MPALDPLPPITLKTTDVFKKEGGDRSGTPYIEIAAWTFPVIFFVGRNGSGKSRTATSIAERLKARLLSTDRLVGLMTFSNYSFGSVPALYKGVPVGEEERRQIRAYAQLGTATEDLYALKEQPEVWLRVAAFVRRTLGRVIELRESAGYLDPYVRLGDLEYSLLRDEGHGLRELVVLLSAAYREDWALLVVDEPELHLHPSLSRLWLTELNRECARTGRYAIVVTHEPSMLKPNTSEELGSIWHFSAGRRPVQISQC